MSKSAVRRLIAGYFLVFFGAIFLRIDYFPLSWVPMYGFREEAETLTVAVGDVDRRELGFAGLRANGERSFLSRRDINVPPANFRRLYQERAFGEGPPQHRRERAELAAFNQWWYERLIGPDPAKDADYPRDLLTSINRTFGLGPQDPRRFVQLEAHLDFATYTRAQLDSGDLLHPVRERRVAIITPTGTHYQRARIGG
ncbi:MAG: hypothetical protein H0W74_05285 [Sphingosinicella sp.]|nr:hypothetical protein [Sphingosinicella sp.]